MASGVCGSSGVDWSRKFRCLALLTLSRVRLPPSRGNLRDRCENNSERSSPPSESGAQTECYSLCAISTGKSLRGLKRLIDGAAASQPPALAQQRIGITTGSLAHNRRSSARPPWTRLGLDGGRAQEGETAVGRAESIWERRARPGAAREKKKERRLQER